MTLITEKNNRTKEVLSRVEKYLSFMRYKLADEEMLKHLQNLKSYYSKRVDSVSEEVCSSNVCLVEQLSGKLVLPLKVKGVFLTEGRPKRKYYSAKELEKAAKNPLNKRFPLMLDHRDNEAGQIVGVVTKIEYDDSVKGIRWWGHINDETFARNVLDKAITEVSVTVFSDERYDELLGVVGEDLTFKELSLVCSGAEPNNSIEPYDYGEYSSGE